MVDPKTGKKLLYWGSGFQPISVREMSDDWQTFKEGSQTIPLIFPGKEKSYTNLLEGSWVDYYNGYYYLYYSGDNCCGDKANYAVLVARSRNATGPFTTFADAHKTGSSAILENDSTWNAPGHNSIFTDSLGNRWTAYHAIWNNNQKAGPKGKNNYVKRVMCINPVIYNNGWPVIVKKF